jgi:hypothetical protein
MRRRYILAAMKTHIRITHVITHNEQNVRPGLRSERTQCPDRWKR